MALKITNLISDKYREHYPKISKLLDEHVEETLTFFVIFPNRELCVRYACSLLMEIDEDW